MNIEMAKTIPIAEIFKALGVKPIRKTNKDEWYISPFRNEKTASFRVITKPNVWFDYGIGIGGDTVKLVCNILEAQKQAHSVSDSLKWLETHFRHITPIITATPVPEIEDDEQDPVLSIKSVKPIKNIALKHYLEKRGIPLSIAQALLKEVRIHNAKSGKNFFALGLENEETGYEVRNTFFQGCIGKKHISFVRGTESPADSINIFEGMFDYLSVVTQLNGKPLKGDTIILNSISCIRYAIPYMKDYGYKTVQTWLDNDEPGKKGVQLLAEFFSTEFDLRHIPMNKQYAGFKDVNDWHKSQLEL